MRSFWVNSFLRSSFFFTYPATVSRPFCHSKLCLLRIQWNFGTEKSAFFRSKRRWIALCSGLVSHCFCDIIFFCQGVVESLIHNHKKNLYFLVDKPRRNCYNTIVKYGGVAQLVRAFGSYPTDRWFDSTRRYQKRNPFCLPRQERFFLAFGAKYSFVGQQTVAADSASLSITNPTAFESRPDIKLYGSGAVVIMIQPQGRGMMISNLDEYIEIDSELMNCFKDTVLKNDILSGEGFPALKPGTTTIACAGNVQRIEVIPRWCCL